MYTTILHEISHILIISNFMYTIYPNGNPLKKFTTMGPEGKNITVSKITSPGVRKFGAKHLNCPLTEFEGWPLENEG